MEMESLLLLIIITTRLGVPIALLQISCCQLECTFPDIDILNGILSNDLHNVILQEEEEEAAAREKEGALILLW